jgi:thiosulfate dehydrogenase
VADALPLRAFDRMLGLLRGSALIGLALTAIAIAGHARAAASAPAPVPFRVPADATIPTGPEGDAIRLGRELMLHTKKMLPRNVGSVLNCTNCHLGAGTQEEAGPYVGLWGVFPEYRSRNGRINTMQERINECFVRSMNGKALVVDSKEMTAMLMYIQWLSTGVPVGVEVVGRGMGDVDDSLKPDPIHGKQIYAAKCAACHGANGEGVKGPAGTYAFPPVWGNASFNVGAGLARTYTAAGFIKHNMPLGQGDSLSAQDAVDVAEYMTHQPRPAFPAARNDYPYGKKPKDARN